MKAGDLAYFRSYSHLLEGATPVFHADQLVAIAEAEGEGALKCFPVGPCGRVYSLQGDTLFPEEVLCLPVGKVPMRRFPAPWGEYDNEIARPCVERRR